jgi:TPR repeat protein
MALGTQPSTMADDHADDGRPRFITANAGKRDRVYQHDHDEELGMYWYDDSPSDADTARRTNVIDFAVAANRYRAANQKKDCAVGITRAAAEEGDVWAQVSLGVMLAQGDGVAQDYAEALIWFRKAAEQGDADAQFNLALMDENGRSVTQDYEQAITWYQQSAAQGVSRAMNNLGAMLFKGRGVLQVQRQSGGTVKRPN